MQNWRPPVLLPEQLLLFCVLRALPVVPYGPVRHIILASPTITFYQGMAMLKDVANSGGELIASTLGSKSSTKSTASVLCAPECDEPHESNRSRRRIRRRRQSSNEPKPESLYKTEGSCKHHGPDSKHVTSKCRDPTLSQRKKCESSVATVGQSQSSSSSVAMFSPVFVASISHSSVSFPRASFQPVRRHSRHFYRSHTLAGVLVLM